jgi:hypothetical protein
MRLEEAGAERGRPRHQSETLHEYARALGTLTGSTEPFHRVAVLVSRAAFAPDGPGGQERQWVDQVLEGIASASGGRATSPVGANRANSVTHGDP